MQYVPHTLRLKSRIIYAASIPSKLARLYCSDLAKRAADFSGFELLFVWAGSVCYPSGVVVVLLAAPVRSCQAASALV